MAKGSWENKVAEWMRGRHGSDELSTCLVLVAVVLVIVNMFVRSLFISLLALALMAYACWRMSSKDLEARENENGVFCEFIGPARAWLRNPAKAAQERKQYKHLKCPSCGKRVRIPRGKGKVRVRCPQCQQKFDARS